MLYIEALRIESESSVVLLSKSFGEDGEGTTLSQLCRGTREDILGRAIYLQVQMTEDSAANLRVNVKGIAMGVK